MTDTQVSPAIDQGIFLLHRNKGREFFQRQQLADAERELEAAVRIRPEDELVLNLLGMVYFRLNKLDQAREIYEKLIPGNPSVYSLRSNLGLIYLKKNQYSEAQIHFVEAARIEPANSKAHMYLGLIYERQKRYLQALSEYKLAKNEKMVAQIEQLLRMFAERGEPLPAAAAEKVEPAESAAPVKSPPVAAVPAPLPPAEHRPPELPEPPEPEVSLQLPRVLPEYMKQTDFFNPQKTAETEAQVERAISAVLGPTAQAPPPPPPASAPIYQAETPAPAAVEPAPPDVVSSIPTEETPVQPPRTSSAAESTDALQRLRLVPLNLDLLTQPSVPYLKCGEDEFRIVNKNYLDIDFQDGVAASSQRLIGAWGLADAEPYEGIDGLVFYRKSGRALLYEDLLRIHIIDLTGDVFFVKPGYVLALQPTLRVHWEDAELFRFLKVDGKGVVALAISTSPIIIAIDEDAPLLVDTSYLAAISSAGPIQLVPSSRAGFIEVRARGSVLLYPATRM
ncbi:MAG: tetratricopeptide repeat protein [Acidobacteria bacterium]|nr:tetratricopeptide repeat protein [Acidobacteriota bacterium]